MTRFVVQALERARSRGRMRRRARLRDGLGLCLLIAFSCDEGFDRVVDILTFVDGGTRLEVLRIEPDDLTLWSLLDAVDLNGDGADEVLLSSHEGLLWMRAHGVPRTLWGSGGSGSVLAAKWAPSTLRHGGRLAVLVDPNDGGAPVLLQLSCTSESEPVCEERSRSELDRQVASIAVADLDEDEIMDVLTWGSDRIALLRGTVTTDGELAWPSREYFGDSRTDTIPSPRLAAADLDGDGHVDVVASQAFQPWGVLVYFGDGAGGWDEVVGELEVDGCSIGRIWIESIDDDGLPDIVTDCEDPAIFMNLGAREFETARLAGSNGGTAGETRVLLGRFRGEGPSLLVLSYVPEHEARLFEPVGDSSWTTTSISVPADDTGFLQEGIAADLDGDGVDELLFLTDVPAGC